MTDRAPLVPFAPFVVAALLAASLPAGARADQATVFAGTWGPAGSSEGRVYRYETGTTWTELSPPAGLMDAVWDLEWHEGELWAAGHVGEPATLDPGAPHGTSGHVFRWDGSTWTEATPLAGWSSAATTVSALDGGVYVTVDQVGLLRWDGGRDWVVVGEFLLAGQSIVSSSHESRPMLYIGQDNTDEFWVHDPSGVLACGVPAGFGCQEPTGDVCSADCHPGSCIHAMAEFDDGDGAAVWAGAFEGRMYRWNTATRLFDRMPNVPAPPPGPPAFDFVHVQGLAARAGRLWAGLSDGEVFSTAHGQTTASWVQEADFGIGNPVSEMLYEPADDRLWVGFGGVPYRWARRDGLSGVSTFDGASWTSRATPGGFATGVLALLAVVPEVECDAGPAQVHECTGGEVEVVLDGSASTWTQGFDATFAWSGPFVEGTADGVSPTVHFPGPGEYEVTLTVSVRGASGSCTTTVSVVDTVPPVVPAQDACIWPPNHRYRCFSASQLMGSLLPGAPPVVDDACDGEDAVLARIVGVASSQPEDVTGAGDGHTQDDALFDDDMVCVRSERLGAMPRARTYTVTLEAVDAAGNAGTAVAVISVPHDQRRSSRCDRSLHDVGLLPHAALPLGPDVREGTYP